jgi:hypothetical protein
MDQLKRAVIVVMIQLIFERRGILKAEMQLSGEKLSKGERVDLNKLSINA